MTIGNNLYGLTLASSMASVILIALIAAVMLSIFVALFLILYSRSRSEKLARENSRTTIHQSSQFVVPHQKYTVQPGTDLLSTDKLSPDEKTVTSSSIEENSTDKDPTQSQRGEGLDSKLGTVQPDLYPRQDDVLHISQAKQQKTATCRGSLHTKLKYDFNTSDFVVKLVEAADLPAMDIGGYSDPYVKISLQPDEQKTIKQSSVQRRTLNPYYDEVFKFPITYDELQGRTLCMNVFDFDKFSRHDAIGDVRIPMWETNVSRQLDVWSDLVKPEKNREEPGDLLFSISYLPTAERLTVVVMNARNLKAMDMNGTSDPYVRVALLHGDRKVKKKKTSIKKNDCDPLWNEEILFNIPLKQLKVSSLELKVFDYDVLSQDELIGQTMAGPNSSEPGRSQWLEMIEVPRKSIAVWHPLQYEQ